MRELSGFTELGSSSRGQELSSWKEIASYLGVSIRTAQMWERERGLPVHRLPGSHGRVIADVSALKAWKHSIAPSSVGIAVPPSRFRRAVAWAKGRPWTWLVAVATLASLVVAGAAVLGYRGRVPAGYHLERNALVILDARGVELWRKAFPDMATDIDGWRVWLGDLDRDGRTEVLYAPRFERPGSGPGLLCFSKDGVERWRFSPGRAERTRAQRFSTVFDVSTFAVAPLGPEGAPRIVVDSNHRLHFPAQVALLAPDGRLLREYWHSGHLVQILIASLGRPGRNVILLGGTHSATKAATLVALDPGTMEGASTEENADFQLQGFVPGRELARLAFPRSCINRLMEPFAESSMLWREGDGIVVNVRHRLTPEGAIVHYSLNPDLTLDRMTVSSNFEQAHAQFFAGGLIDHALREKEADALREITYLKRLGAPTE